ncbi:hypothetical protein TthHC11_03830 [Thermus thermophilus]|nr:hypothetical protein TthHC11_03830 [Thermus thermophilus]
MEAGEGPREGGDQVEVEDLEAPQEVEQKEEAGGHPPAEIGRQHDPLSGVAVHQGPRQGGEEDEGKAVEEAEEGEGGGLAPVP